MGGKSASGGRVVVALERCFASVSNNGGATGTPQSPPAGAEFWFEVPDEGLLEVEP